MEDTLSAIVGGATISHLCWARRTKPDESLSMSRRGNVPQLERSSAHPQA